MRLIDGEQGQRVGFGGGGTDGRPEAGVFLRRAVLAEPGAAADEQVQQEYRQYHGPAETHPEDQPAEIFKRGAQYRPLWHVEDADHFALRIIEEDKDVAREFVADFEPPARVADLPADSAAAPTAATEAPPQPSLPEPAESTPPPPKPESGEL